MATMPMPITDQEMPHANDDEDGTPPEKITKKYKPDNPLLATEFNECHVEMIAVDDIFSARDGQHDALVNALADSISHIGLQNPICVVLNDIEGHPAKYRIVSGRKRYTAFVKLGRDQIPAHILTFVPEDPHTDVRKQLAEYEENLVRDQLSLLELCDIFR